MLTDINRLTIFALIYILTDIVLILNLNWISIPLTCIIFLQSFTFFRKKGLAWIKALKYTKDKLGINSEIKINSNLGNYHSFCLSLLLLSSLFFYYYLDNLNPETIILLCVLYSWCLIFAEFLLVDLVGSNLATISIVSEKIIKLNPNSPITSDEVIKATISFNSNPYSSYNTIKMSSMDGKYFEDDLNIEIYFKSNCLFHVKGDIIVVGEKNIQLKNIFDFCLIYGKNLNHFTKDDFDVYSIYTL